jgi:hypothetical protein
VAIYIRGALARIISNTDVRPTPTIDPSRRRCKEPKLKSLKMPTRKTPRACSAPFFSEADFGADGRLLLYKRDRCDYRDDPRGWPHVPWASKLEAWRSWRVYQAQNASDDNAQWHTWLAMRNLASAVVLEA